MVVVYLLIAALAAVILFAGFGLITGGATTAVNDIGNHTANTSAWGGFAATNQAAPLLILILFFGMVVYGVWQYVKRWRGKKGNT